MQEGVGCSPSEGEETRGRSGRDGGRRKGKL